MQAEKEKQMDMDNVDSADAGEERLRDEQISEGQVVEERVDQKRQAGKEEDFAPLFERNVAEKFREQWLEIQSRFVDDPSVSVKAADDLVADVIKDITRQFSDERLSLENQWKSGDKVSTEDLRLAMQRYRSFFNRLLSLES